MTSKATQRQRIFRAGMAALIMGSVLGLTGVLSTPAGAAVRPHQVEICHATSSVGHPFTTPTPAKWQITAPHGHGTLDTLDIIPPFEAGTHGGKSWEAYDGLNWDATYPGTDLTGEEIAAAGCNIVVPAAGSITLAKVTAGDGEPVGSTDFTFSVSCQDANVPDAAPTVSPDDAAVTVATEVAVQSTCTITETGAAGAASTSYAVDGGAEQSGASVTVTMANDDQVVAVVFTNTYQCPTGQTPDGDGGCTQSCVPSVANNQCNPCESGTADGQGGCTQVEDIVVTSTDPLTPSAPSGPAPRGATEVQGVSLSRPATQVQASELARTGSNTVPMVELGLGLVLLGFGALVFAREHEDQTV